MPNKKFQVPINLVNLSSDPVSGSEGDMYYNTTSDVVKVYANGSWIQVGSGLSQEDVQDYVAPLFTHSNHTNASVTYEDALNEIHIDVINAPSAGYTSTVKHSVKLNGSIAKGQAVYVSSSNGTNMVVSKASNASEATSSKTMGLLETGGSNNSTVNVVTEGLLAGLDTSTADTEGDPVWLGTDGNLIYGLTNKPYAPAHLVFIGIVTRKNANNGEIFVKVQNGFELNELHTVQLESNGNIADNEVLAYDSATTLWKNQTPAEAGLASLSGATFTGAVNGTSLTLSGDLTINGTTTTINSTTLSVDDKNIELGSVASPTNTTADGGGITLKGATDKTLNWVNSTSAWTSSENIDLASGKTLKINGADVLSATNYTGNAATVTNGVYTTDTGTVTSTMIANGTIVDADINASAAIADTKLATISTAGKVSNSATTAVEDGRIVNLGTTSTIDLFNRQLIDTTRGMSSGIVYLTGFVPAKNFTLNSVTVDVRTTGTGTLYALLCTTSSATPSVPTVVANTTGLATPATGTQTLTFSSAQSLTAGNTYAIAFYSQGGTCTLSGHSLNAASHAILRTPPFVAGVDSTTYTTIANLSAGTTIGQNTAAGTASMAWARLA